MAARDARPTAEEPLRGLREVDGYLASAVLGLSADVLRIDAAGADLDSSAA